MWGTVENWFNNRAEKSAMRAGEEADGAQRADAGRIPFDLSTIEWKMVARKKAFYTGVPMFMEEKMSDVKFE